MIVDAYATILREFGWLADLYTLDYFIEKHWHKLLKSWQHFFSQCFSLYMSEQCVTARTAVIELVDALLNPNSCNFRAQPFPLSLIALKRCVYFFSLERTALCNKMEIEHRIFGNNKLLCNGVWTNLNEVLPHRLRVKIKEKKSHEIGRIYDLLDVIQQRLAVEYPKCVKWRIIDIGSGVGHLSRILQLLLDCEVETIEGNAQFVETSLRMDKRFDKLVKINCNNTESFLTSAVAEWRLPTRQLAFVEVEHQILKNRQQLDEITEEIVLVGLHTCGDLSATILRNFVANNTAKILLNFGCCYHKLNNGEDKLFRDVYENEPKSSVHKGYPLSKMFSGLHLSYASRELACFSVENFLKKLQQTRHSKALFVNGYRAVLEWLILDCPSHETECNPVRRHCGLRGVKNAEEMHFWEYVDETLRDNTELASIVHKYKTNSDVLQTINKWLESENEKILIMYTLRQIIAPLIETILIEDRRHFLVEDHQLPTTFVLSLFNPTISPRNIALISIKPC